MYDLIIVPIDGSKAASDAADHGVCQAVAHDARLVFLAVVEMSGTAAPEAHDSDVIEEQRVTQQDELASLVEKAQSAGVDADGVVETGVPSRIILEQASEREADLLVMATSARSGVGRFLYGSVTEQVIREADTPVLAIQR
ncbi:universal stress protein [Halovenus rubra]|uniref:Universal stress protein n=2 Tax=Halovenus rubra TaxID=869890 RepID=A0ABD5X7L4_9EURY